MRKYTVNVQSMRVEHIELVLNSILSKDPYSELQESKDDLNNLLEELKIIEAYKPYLSESVRILKSRIYSKLDSGCII